MAKQRPINQLSPEEAREIRTTFYPVACSLIAHGEILQAASRFGNRFEFVFNATPFAQQLFAQLSTADGDALVPIRRYMKVYDIFRDAIRRGDPLPIGVQLFPSIGGRQS